jgi:tRNA (cytidine/uridine-2'-O-)-methyltransferase
VSQTPRPGGQIAFSARDKVETDASQARRYADAMRIALYQPDIPQNAGTILRLCACFGIEAHIIEPAGFPASDRAFRRAGLDYLDAVTMIRHRSWLDFETWCRGEHSRLLLFTTAGALSYLDFGYRADDILLFGRESAGVPTEVHAAADARLLIPMRKGLRSLNVALAAAMAVGEALRQTQYGMQ